LDNNNTLSYLRELSVSVPITIKWDPETARQLIVRLFAFNEPMNLLITAEEMSIRWCIEIPGRIEKAVVRTIYALYPEADIIAKQKSTSHIQYRLYQVQSVYSFVAPFLYVQDYGKLDPLAAILSLMVDLTEEERIIYQISLRPPQKNYKKLGEKVITTSTVRWWNFLTIDGAANAFATKATGTDKIDRFSPQFQKAARTKLQSPLMEVEFSIKCQADSRVKADELISSLIPALAIYELEGSNKFVAARKCTFPLVLSAPEVAALWHLPNETCKFPGIKWVSSHCCPAPTRVVQNHEGIFLGVNSYADRQCNVRMPYSDRVAHVYVCGRTSVGKSTLLHHMIHQDIMMNKGVAVIDPHGKLIRDILRCSIPEHREKDVVLVDFAETNYPPPLNPFALPDGVPKEIAMNVILDLLKKVFEDDWSRTRMESAIYSALVALLYDTQATPRDISRIFLDPKYRNRLLGQVKDPVALEYWQDEYDQLSPGVKKQTREPVLNRIRIFYRNSTVRNMVCYPHRLNFSQIIDEGKIFLASLNSDEVRTEQSNLGAMLIANFKMAVMTQRGDSRFKHEPFYLFIDEVQQFITTSLPEVFSEARKFGLSLTVANQFLGQLKGKTLEAILGNVGAAIIFACGPDDSRALAPYVRPEFRPDDLINFDCFHAAVKMHVRGKTMNAFSLNTYSPIQLPHDAIDRETRIRKMSIEQYTPWTRAEVEAWLEKRYDHYGNVNRSGFVSDYD
jgi:hypothetical protein